MCTSWSTLHIGPWRRQVPLHLFLTLTLPSFFLSNHFLLYPPPPSIFNSTAVWMLGSDPVQLPLWRGHFGKRPFLNFGG